MGPVELGQISSAFGGRGLNEPVTSFDSRMRGSTSWNGPEWALVG